MMTITNTNTKSESPATYSLEPEERAAIEKVFEQRKIAPAPRLKVEDNAVSIDHPHKLTGHLLVQNALGSLDDGFTNGLIKQLSRATSGGCQKIDEVDLNFMLSFIKGIEPRDQLESTLAAQMAAVHMAMMKFAEILPTQENLPQVEAAERAINRFARTFTAQMETFKRYRSNGEQSVTVQHVSVKEAGHESNANQSPHETAPRKASSRLALIHSKTAPTEIIGASPRPPTSVKRKLSQ